MSRFSLRRAAFAACCLVALAAPGSALAWLAPGHMATGAVAYDTLERRDPDAVAAIVALERAHPDAARFDRRLGDAQGNARARKLFELMARWPDDVRGSPYDHPTWHYSEKIQSSLRYVLPFAWGRARSAYLKELAVARDPKAPAAERAIALCWVLHIAGDMHEPEHAGLWMGGRFPLTDEAGNAAWVRTTPAMRPEKLHWLWDSAGAEDPDEGRRRDADAFAARIEAEHPDPGLAPPSDAGHAFDTWVDESRDISKRVVYRNGALVLGASPAAAALLPPGYVEQAQQIAEARLALAGYRIAAVLQGLR
ncbi:MAG: S1/P1 nuclease [Caulobacteraceae bacterium]